MKKFTILLRHQIWQMAISPATYFAAFLFLGFMSFMFLLSIHDISIVASKQSPVEKFLSLFWLPVLFMVPLLTMRSLSEELRRGTLGSLMTVSVSAWQIVLAKFLACYFFYILLWALTLSFPAVACRYLPHASAADMFEIPQLCSGYGFIMLTGALYVAVGIFASSLTRTTLVAGMLSFGMLFFLIVGASIAESLPAADDSFGGAAARVSDYLHTFRQLDSFNGGLVDSRAFFFYASFAAALLAMTSLITESKNR